MVAHYWLNFTFTWNFKANYYITFDMQKRLQNSQTRIIFKINNFASTCYPLVFTIHKECMSIEFNWFASTFIWNDCDAMQCRRRMLSGRVHADVLSVYRNYAYPKYIRVYAFISIYNKPHMTRIKYPQENTIHTYTIDRQQQARILLRLQLFEKFF